MKKLKIPLIATLFLALGLFQASGDTNLPSRELGHRPIKNLIANDLTVKNLLTADITKTRELWVDDVEVTGGVSNPFDQHLNKTNVGVEFESLYLGNDGFEINYTQLNWEGAAVITWSGSILGGSYGVWSMPGTSTDPDHLVNRAGISLQIAEVNHNPFNQLLNTNQSVEFVSVKSSGIEHNSGNAGIYFGDGDVEVVGVMVNSNEDPIMDPANQQLLNDSSNNIWEAVGGLELPMIVHDLNATIPVAINAKMITKWVGYGTSNVLYDISELGTNVVRVQE